MTEVRSGIGNVDNSPLNASWSRGLNEVVRLTAGDGKGATNRVNLSFLRKMG